ncbi:MAG: NAD(P)/FAD-dependent oxidoreductase, partial [Blastocatellia bacterium]
HIAVLANTTITAIHQQPQNKLVLQLTDAVRQKQQTLLVDGLCVRLGIEPNTAFLQYQIATDENGYLLVNGAQRTSLPHVYAIGDVCRPVCFSVATAIGQGAIAVKDIARRLQRGE